MFADINTLEYRSLEAIRRERNVSIPAEPSEALLAELGVVRVVPTVQPSADVVTLGPPKQDPDTEIWYQTWTTRAFTPEEKAERLRVARQEASEGINEARDEAFASGMPYEVGEDEFTVQTRPIDQMNLMAFRIEAKELLDAELTDQRMEFRTLENTSVYLTPAEMVTMADQALARLKAIYKKSWVLKAQIAEAATPEAAQEVTWDAEPEAP